MNNSFAYVVLPPAMPESNSKDISGEFKFTFSVTADEAKRVNGDKQTVTLKEQFVTVLSGFSVTWTITLVPHDDFDMRIHFTPDKKEIRVLSGRINVKKGGVYINTVTFLNIRRTDEEGLNPTIANSFYSQREAFQAETIFRVTMDSLSQLLPSPKAPMTEPSNLGIFQHLLSDQESEESDMKWAEASIECSDGVLRTSRFNLAYTSPYYSAAFRSNERQGMEITLFKLADQVESKVSPCIASAIERNLTLTANKDGFGPVDEVLDTFHFADLHSFTVLRNLALTELSGRLDELPHPDLPGERGKPGLSWELWSELCRLNRGRIRVNIM